MQNIAYKNVSLGLKIMTRYIQPYKQTVITLIVLSIISAGFNSSIPYLTGKLFDSIIKPDLVSLGGKIITSTMFFLLLWLFVKTIGDIIDWRLQSLNSRLSTLIEADYNVQGFSLILKLPITFHKSRKGGEIGDRITRAAGWLSTIVEDVIVYLAPQFLSVVIALIICFFINPILGLLLLSAVSIYTLILFYSTPKAVILQRKMQKAYHKAYGDTYDSLMNIRTVKYAAAENYEKKKLYRGFHLRAIGFWNKLVQVWQKLTFFQRILVTASQFFIFLISLTLISQNKMSIGELIMFTGYAGMLFGPFVEMGHNWQTIQNGFSAILRTEKILSQKTEQYEPAKPVNVKEIKGEVVFDKVKFAYGKNKKLVLNNISLRVKPGMTVALVGGSGVGKSTFVDLLSRFYNPTSGKISIDGHSIKNYNLKFLRSQIATVPQEIILFNDTIKNNIRYGNFSASDEKIKAAAEQAHADKFIQLFPKKYNQRVGERGVKLSVGQKQRIAIARAILRNPKILILDEPTSALDAESEKIIQESFRNLMKGRTTFIIAHRLSTIREVDVILVIKEGKIIEQGNHNELLQIPNGIYKNLYELQMGFY